MVPGFSFQSLFRCELTFKFKPILFFPELPLFILERRKDCQLPEPDVIKFPFLGNDPLMRQLYEIDVSPEALPEHVPPTQPSLWRYRVQVTIEHLKTTFQEEVASADNTKYPVLAAFLAQVMQRRLTLRCTAKVLLLIFNIEETCTPDYNIFKNHRAKRRTDD